MDLRTDSLIIGCKDARGLEAWRVKIRFIETIWRRGHRRVSAVGDLIEGNRRSRLDHLNWVDDLLNPTDDNISSATKTDGGVVDIIQEDAFVFQVESRFVIVEVGSEDDATPITAVGGRCWGVRISSDAFIQPRRDIDIPLGRAQYLQCPTAAIDR